MKKVTKVYTVRLTEEEMTVLTNALAFAMLSNPAKARDYRLALKKLLDLVAK